MRSDLVSTNAQHMTNVQHKASLALLGLTQAGKSTFQVILGGNTVVATQDDDYPDKWWFDSPNSDIKIQTKQTEGQSTSKIADVTVTEYEGRFVRIDCYPGGNENRGYEMQLKINYSNFMHQETVDKMLPVLVVNQCQFGMGGCGFFQDLLCFTRMFTDISALDGYVHLVVSQGNWTKKAVLKWLTNTFQNHQLLKGDQKKLIEQIIKSE